jgi:hypothetical protein
MTDRMNFQRSAPLSTSVERFIRPERVEDGHLVGHVWQPELRREVSVAVNLPKSWDEAEVLEAAAAGSLVLDRSLRRLTWARG